MKQTAIQIEVADKDRNSPLSFRDFIYYSDYISL